MLLILTHTNNIVSQLNLDFSNNISFQRTLKLKLIAKSINGILKNFLEVKSKKFKKNIRKEL